MNTSEKMGDLDKLPTEQRKDWLKTNIQKNMSWFAEDCKAAKLNNTPASFSEDLFMPEYTVREFVTLGVMVKYAHLVGVDVLVVCPSKNKAKMG